MEIEHQLLGTIGVGLVLDRDPCGVHPVGVQCLSTPSWQLVCLREMEGKGFWLTRKQMVFEGILAGDTISTCRLILQLSPSMYFFFFPLDPHIQRKGWGVAEPVVRLSIAQSGRCSRGSRPFVRRLLMCFHGLLQSLPLVWANYGSWDKPGAVSEPLTAVIQMTVTVGDVGQTRAG